MQLTLSETQHASTTPICPLCGARMFVQEYEVGFITLPDIPFETVENEAVQEKLHAPHTCIHEEYDWDCTHCMSVFSSPS